MKKTKFIRFRVTPEERRIVENKAAIARRPISSFARDCVLNKEIIVLPGMEQAVAELKRVGNHLNQITILARMGRAQVFSLEEMKREVNALWRSVNSCLPNRR